LDEKRMTQSIIWDGAHLKIPKRRRRIEEIEESEKRREEELE
jgi:hypothetical protein